MISGCRSYRVLTRDVWLAAWGRGSTLATAPEGCWHSWPCFCPSPVCRSPLTLIIVYHTPPALSLCLNAHWEEKWLFGCHKVRWIEHEKTSHCSDNESAAGQTAEWGAVCKICWSQIRRLRSPAAHASLTTHF